MFITITHETDSSTIISLKRVTSTYSLFSPYPMVVVQGDQNDQTPQEVEACL